MTNTRHDCFVGNLSYNTTEESLKEVFSRVGEVINIRICTDRETGRPKGYAFIEYADAATALSAIRNLDGADFNSRKLRVSYSNNSILKDVAREMGQVVHDSYQSGEH
jgi:cleavage stimulation factor subunit 2